MSHPPVPPSDSLTGSGSPFSPPGGLASIGLTYTKPALAPAALLTHLVQRGLNVSDLTAAMHALEHIGYFRLLIYMRAVQSAGGKWFNPGATVEQIVQLYEFDRELRLLCLDAIERIEVALRAAINNTVGVAHGPHFYEDPRHFVTHKPWFDHAKLLTNIDKTLSDGDSLAVAHYKRTYAVPARPPIWVVLEAVTYGTLSRFFSALNPTNQRRAAGLFRHPAAVLVSWFRALTTLRNICAHHGRLWNAPLIANQPMAAHAFVAEFPSVDTTYARLVVLSILLDDVETSASSWRSRVVSLFGRYPMVPEVLVGCPPGWTTRSIWM